MTTQNSFQVLKKIVHELFGEESDIQLQLYQVSITLLMLSISQLAQDLADNA